MKVIDKTAISTAAVAGAVTYVHTTLRGIHALACQSIIYLPGSKIDAYIFYN